MKSQCPSQRAKSTRARRPTHKVAPAAVPQSAATARDRSAAAAAAAAAASVRRPQTTPMATPTAPMTFIAPTASPPTPTRVVEITSAAKAAVGQFLASHGLELFDENASASSPPEPRPAPRGTGGSLATALRSTTPRAGQRREQTPRGPGYSLPGAEAPHGGAWAPPHGAPP